MEGAKILLLDNTFFPIRFVNWKRAMVLFLSNRAEALELYEKIRIRSVSPSFPLPKVLRLFGIFKKDQQVKFCRHNVFLRDHWTCQYCRKEFTAKNLTLDHVIPKSRGGNTSWENVVTACSNCNHKKGDRLLEESSFRLLKTPKRPKWRPCMNTSFRNVNPEEWGSWITWKTGR